MASRKPNPIEDPKDARKVKPVVDTHADTATSTRETIVQYFAVHLNGETALTRPGDDVTEDQLLEMLETNEYLKLQNAHTLLKKTTEVIFKRTI